MDLIPASLSINRGRNINKDEKGGLYVKMSKKEIL
jgi:hypothetical protein